MLWSRHVNAFFPDCEQMTRLRERIHWILNFQCSIILDCLCLLPSAIPDKDATDATVESVLVNVVVVETP